MKSVKKLNIYDEPHIQRFGSRMNSLRAAVLGSNDGIISTAGLVVGVAGATSSAPALITAGVAGVVAGALSMAAGEFISVSSQRDVQKVQLETERKQLETNPVEEFEELIQMYQIKGLTRSTAEKVASELSKNDAFSAHVAIELNIDPTDLTNPWHAAIASTLSFTIGAIIPLVTIVLSPHSYKIINTFIAVVIALVITGSLSAQISGANKGKAILRVLIGGMLAMIITYAIGRLIGSSHL
jgi:VIT1/CCC1 family predicted Fe2+/Mn2+ transporter